MNETRKAYKVLFDLRFALDGKEDEQSKELVEALEIALPLVRGGIKCDRCGAKAVELSDSTGLSYCKRCYRAVTDPKTPY